jgi:hypothetical protein
MKGFKLCLEATVRSRLVAGIAQMGHAEFQTISKAVDKAISHIVSNGMDDIFKRPMFSESYELEIIRANRDDFEQFVKSETISFLKTADLTKKRIGQIFGCMVPKDLYSYRNVHWIDPIDLVKYLSLSMILFENIEQARPAADTKIVHSHRRSEDGDHVFSRDYGYKSFREVSGEISRDMVGKWKIVTDISAFFDRIGNHQLENHLRESGCNGKFVTLMREVLLQWAGDRRSHGIPVGCDASRIISEAALVSVDRELMNRGIRYLRYVDDFRIFAETRAEAYEHLRILSELLMAEGLYLNHKKTFIAQIVPTEIYNEINELGFSDEHEVIDESARILKSERVRVSGRSTLSRRYIEPGKEAVAKLKKIPKHQIQSDYMDAADNHRQELVKLVVKYFLYVDQDISLIEMVISRQITSIIYLVDALTKEYERISPEMREQLKELIFTGMGGLGCGYPFQISLIRLFSSPGFVDARTINFIVDNAKITDNTLFLREAIFVGYEQLDKIRMRKLALEVFPMVHPHTKRAIYFAICRYSKMTKDEKRPIIKNMLQVSDDWFIHMDRMRGQ